MMNKSEPYLLEARNLSFCINRALTLQNVSLTVKKQETLGIIGPNGSGKTTLIKLLTGILQPTGGSVLFKSLPLRAYSRKTLAKEMALAPQSSGTNFPFSASQMVMMGRYAHLGAALFESKRDLEIVREAMQFTGVLPFAERSFNTLSGGERQRVIIASALAQQAQLLFLDEPTSSLDVKYQAEIFETLRKLNVQRNYTIVIALHDLNLAARFCTRLLALKNGEVAAVGTPEQVLQPDVLEPIYETELEIIKAPENGGFYMLPKIRPNHG